MTEVYRVLAVCLLSAIPVGATVVLAETTSTPSSQGALEREGMIFERQQIMMQLGRDSELLGKIVAGTEPASKLPETTRAIASGARESLDAYRNLLPGGQTKAEAWSNHDDFMQRMDKFARNADAMAAAGERGDMTGVRGLMVDALPCKQCHDVYRAPKPR
jgi:cytochrome c556